MTAGRDLATGMAPALAAGHPSGGGALGRAQPAAAALPARFMALGLLLLAGLAALAPWSMWLLLTHFYEPRLLAFVHLNTLGVIGALALGLSYRLIPAALQTPLAAVRLGRLSFWCYFGGLIGLPVGLARTWLPALAVGGVLLTIAFLLAIVVIAATLRRAPRRDIVAWHIAVSLAGLAAGVAYGLILAINKGTGFLGASTLHQIAAHTTIMLGGWIAVLLAGISLRVPASPGTGSASSTTGAWLALTLIAGGSWLLSTNLHLAGPAPANLAGAVALLGGMLLVVGRLVMRAAGHSWRHEVYLPFAVAAGLFGLAAAALLVAGLARDLAPGDRIWLIAGWLAIAGLAETALQGICYAAGTGPGWRPGRKRVVRPSGVDSRLALAGWTLWVLGVVLEAAAVASAGERLSRVAGILLALGVACFLTNLLRLGAGGEGSARVERTVVP